MALVEIAQAVDAPIEGDHDEIEGAESDDIPLHVGQHDVAVFG